MEQEKYRRCNETDCIEYYYKTESEGSICFIHERALGISENNVCNYRLKAYSLEEIYSRK